MHTAALFGLNVQFLDFSYTSKNVCVLSLLFEQGNDIGNICVSSSPNLSIKL